MGFVRTRRIGVVLVLGLGGSVLARSADPPTDLQLDIAAGVYAPGGQFTYTFVVRNFGPNDAKEITIESALPLIRHMANPRVTCNTWRASCGAIAVAEGNMRVTGARVEKSIGEDRSHVTIGVTGTLDAEARGTYRADACVIAQPDVDAYAENDCSYHNTQTGETAAELSADLFGPSEHYAPGDALEYTLTVHNYGPNQSGRFAVKVPIPSGLGEVVSTCVHYPSYTGCEDRGLHTTGSVVHVVPTLPYREGVLIVVSARVGEDAIAPLNLSAQILVDADTDPDQWNNRPTWVVLPRRVFSSGMEAE